MVTVWMAIRRYMGLGWQFAFEQWGSASKGTVTYPVSFSKFCMVVLGPWKGSTPTDVPYHGAKNNSTFYLGTDNSDWIAIGA